MAFKLRNPFAARTPEALDDKGALDPDSDGDGIGLDADGTRKGSYDVKTNESTREAGVEDGAAVFGAGEPSEPVAAANLNSSKSSVSLGKTVEGPAGAESEMAKGGVRGWDPEKKELVDGPAGGGDPGSAEKVSMQDMHLSSGAPEPLGYAVATVSNDDTSLTASASEGTAIDREGEQRWGGGGGGGSAGIAIDEPGVQRTAAGREPGSQGGADPGASGGTGIAIGDPGVNGRDTAEHELTHTAQQGVADGGVTNEDAWHGQEARTSYDLKKNEGSRTGEAEVEGSDEPGGIAIEEQQGVRIADTSAEHQVASPRDAASGLSTGRTAASDPGGAPEDDSQEQGARTSYDLKKNEGSRAGGADEQAASDLSGHSGTAEERQKAWLPSNFREGEIDGDDESATLLDLSGLTEGSGPIAIADVDGDAMDAEAVALGDDEVSADDETDAGNAEDLMAD